MCSGSQVNLLSLAQNLEEAYPHGWTRTNVDARIALHRNALAAISSSSSSGCHPARKRGTNSNKSCMITLEPLNSTYECAPDPAQFQFTTAIRDLLSRSHSRINWHVGITSSSSLLRQKHWLGLAQAHQDLYEHDDSPTNLEAQLACATHGLVSSSDTESQSMALLSVGSALLVRGKRFHSATDIEATLATLTHALNIYNSAGDNRAILLYRLACGLQERYSHKGDISDVMSSITMLTEAAGATTENHPLRCRFIHILAWAHHLLARVKGRPEDVLDYQRLMTEAVRLCPPGHIYRATALMGMGNMLWTLYERSSNIDHLDQAIKAEEEGLNACPERFNYLRSSLLNGLCIQLRLRFSERGCRLDLNKAILAGRQGIELDPLSGALLTNLSIALEESFDQDGNVHDLDESVNLRRRTLSICKPGHPQRYLATNNLGRGLVMRSRLSFNAADLDEGIMLLRESASLFPPGHPEWARTCENLIGSLRDKYTVMKDLTALEEAIELNNVMLDYYDKTSDEAAGWTKIDGISSRASLLTLRFQHAANINDINAAIRDLEEVTTDRPKEHVKQPLSFHELAVAYRLRFQALQCIDDGQRAFIYHQMALDYLPPGPRFRPQALLGLARLNVSVDRSDRSIDTALDLYCQALTDCSCTAQIRLEEGVPVLDDIHKALVFKSICTDTRVRLLEAFRITVHLLPQVAYFGLNIKSRLRVLSQAPSLAADAAARAILLEDPKAALELLEEGRAVFWVQHLRLRSSFDMLPFELADELKQISRELDMGSRHVSEPSRADNEALTKHEEELAHRHRLSERFEALIVHARSSPGMERFMLHNSFTIISKAAHRIPVVVLLATSDYCGALLMRSSESNVQQVKFGRRVDLRSLHVLTSVLLSNRRDARGTGCTRAMKKSGGDSKTRIRSTQDVYDELWSQVVQVIVHALGLKEAEGRQRPRVMICVTGQFTHVPLHAAGGLLKGCWNYLVPSYTPTLGALIVAQEGFSPVRRSKARTILAAVPRPFKWSSLHATIDETNLLVDILPPELVVKIPSKPSLAIDGGGSAACTDVLNGLSDAVILHLACHGYQDPNSPLDSGFVMRDRVLTLSQLMELNLPNAFLAFLSACETAKTAEDQPDQAVHLAATMLFTGFKSVIGTMWSMGDMDGPVVAKRVYEELFRGKEEYLDPDSIPYALDAAVGSLREQRLHPSRWAPYVHFGI